MSSETRVFVIRHGESQAQVAQILSGHDTCTGLTDLGRAQVGALERAPRADRRARHRGRGLHERAARGAGDRGDPAARPSVALEATRSATGARSTPARPRAWGTRRCGPSTSRARELRGPYDRPIPEGESWADLYTRVGTRLQRAVADHEGETVVVAGHGGTIGASFVSFGQCRCPGHRHRAHRAQRVDHRVGGHRRPVAARALQRRRPPPRPLAVPSRRWPTTRRPCSRGRRRCRPTSPGSRPTTVRRARDLSRRSTDAARRRSPPLRRLHRGGDGRARRHVGRARVRRVVGGRTAVTRLGYGDRRPRAGRRGPTPRARAS